MYYEAELVFKSYNPLKLEKGMLFIDKIHPNTRKETIIIRELKEIPFDEEEYLRINGCPVLPYIVDNDNPHKDPIVLATPEQIGWFDQGEQIETLSDITVYQMNIILDNYDGRVDIEVELEETSHEADEQLEEKIVPVLYMDKVTLKYYEEEYEAPHSKDDDYESMLYEEGENPYYEPGGREWEDNDEDISMIPFKN
jgi:hypothetical protein